MKTLKQHTFIYDQDCPLCRVYTGAFIKNKWLDENGRTAYQQITDESTMDMNRAKSEVALIDHDSGNVHYGIDALMLVIGHNAPVLQPLFNLKWFRWMMRRFYFFISYNRKIIAATKPSANSLRTCTPAFSMTYRVAFLLITWLFVSIILNQFSHTLAGIIPHSSFIRELAICGGQIFFQGGVILLLKKPLQLMDYLGNMMTVSLIGALLLLPALLVKTVFPAINPTIILGYFMLVVGVMLLEHSRRMKLLGLGLLPSVTWVLYRLLVLSLILL